MTELLERTRAIALEFCDESDIRFYEKKEEYHVVLPQKYQEEVTKRFQQLGWNLSWKKENIRDGWNRLAFKQK